MFEPLGEEAEASSIPEYDLDQVRLATPGTQPQERTMLYNDSSTEVPVAPSVVTSLWQRDFSSFRSASSGTGFLVP